MNNDTNHNSASFSGNDPNSIDFDKLWSIIKRSALWIVLIFAITLSVAYFTIRWTKPLYKSESELKLEFKSEASALGISNMMENQNLNQISGEIELLSSKLFFKKVIDLADINVSYNSRGNILNEERYRFTPFVVDYELNGSNLLNKEIDINFISNDEFKLNYEYGGQQHSSNHSFGESINLLGSKIVVKKTSYFKPDDNENYFFVIKSLDALYSYLDNNLEVSPLNFKANTIKITVKDHNRYKARDIVNIIDSIYLDYSQEQKTIENNSKIEWLNQELKSVESRLEEYEDYFEKFTITNRTNNLDRELVETVKAIRVLDSTQYNLNYRLSVYESIQKDLASSKTLEVLSIDPEILTPSLLKLVNDYNEQTLDFERIKQSYSENTTAYSNRERQLTVTVKLLESGIAEKINTIQDNLKQVRSRKYKLEKSFNTIPAKEREFKKAQLYYSLYEDHYLALIQARTDFEVAKAGTKNDIIILSPATLPANPISPDKPIIYGIGIVAGLVLSLLFIGVRYLVSNTISGLNELERLSMETTILGVIPKLSGQKLNETKLIVEESSRTSISEALRSIRTNLEFLSTNKKSKIISVTSTVSSEGKTFVSVNLGGILALSKRKVVVVDMDMRKPQVHRAFDGIDIDKGVSTVLIGKHSIDESIKSTSIDNLHYLPAGPTPPNPSELLLNGAYESLLNELSKKYDYVVLDTPPASIVTDAILVMKRVDIPIYVFRAEFSKKQFVKVLNRLKYVNKFDNIAIVLNGLKSGNNKYGYGYYVN